MHWSKITLIGVGLLGGSLGLAIKRHRLADRVEGFVRRQASVDECVEAGVVDHATRDLLGAVRDADLVVFCTPLSQMKELAAAMLPALKRNAIVTDVGSVKGSVVRDLEGVIRGGGGSFLGSHPMAGSHKTGVGAAKVGLFEGAMCVITPTPRTAPEAIGALETFWTAVGCRLLRLTPELHDEFVGRSSHLPHVVAAELANYVLSPAHSREQALLCASGFRDTTRIASGSPEMWRDIAMANRKNLARVIGVFVEDLQEFQLALENGDPKTVHDFFEKARERREAWLAQAGSESPERGE